MTLLDKIKLIDFYLHGVDRDIRKDEGDFESVVECIKYLNEKEK